MTDEEKHFVHANCNTLTESCIEGARTLLRTNKFLQNVMIGSLMQAALHDSSKREAYIIGFVEILAAALSLLANGSLHVMTIDERIKRGDPPDTVIMQDLLGRLEERMKGDL